jgi:hypothetical protein
MIVKINKMDKFLRTMHFRERREMNKFQIVMSYGKTRRRRLVWDRKLASVWIVKKASLCM